MKSLYNPLTVQQRKQAHISIKREVAELMEARRYYNAVKDIAMACDALHERFHFGRSRLCEFVLLMGDASKENIKDTIDGVDDELLCRRLDRMGMPELASVLREERKKLDELEAAK